jgi:TIGR03009 family protein
MQRITPSAQVASAQVAISFCSAALITVSTALSQGQLGPPQAVPQSPYPQTGATATQPAAQAPVQLQQGAATQQQPAAPGAPQTPAGFQLNALEQAELDQVLNSWQAASSKITSFRCAFRRWEYDMAFSPRINNELAPLNKNLGELSYNKPDKGSFEITEINTFKQEQAPAATQPGQPPAPVKGDWVKQPDAIGEHWVSDGKSIFEYRPLDKQLVERPIPLALQGQAIVDGPLPFLFGAEAAKLKQRYWMKILHAPEVNENPEQIWLLARPKFQEQAANFKEVNVIFNRKLLMPQAMQVTLPNDDRHAYMFDITNAKTNGVGGWLNGLFSAPRVPHGWQRVVENMPVAQVPQQPAQNQPQTK